MANKECIFITGGTGLLGLNWGLRMRSRYDVTLGLHEKSVTPPGVKTVAAKLESQDAVCKAIEQSGAGMVIHTAGLTNIEQCEKEPDLAMQINAQISANVSNACRQIGIPMVHISTDNLFDGEDSMVTEDHEINPVNVYGKTKAEAEKRILDLNDDALVVRTNFYGWGSGHKPSFSDLILTKLRQGTKMSLFSDVFYTPIYMPVLIDTVHEALEKGGRGVFHIVGDEKLSKLSFGLKIADKFTLDEGLIESGKLGEMKNLVKRPFDMSLSNAKIKSFLGHGIGDVDFQLDVLKKDETTQTVKDIQHVG